MSDDQEKIKIAREYFMRADQGRPFLQRLQVSRWPNIEPAHLS